MGIVDAMMKQFRANPAYKLWAVVVRAPEGDLVRHEFRSESADCAARVREDFFKRSEVLWFGLKSELPAEYAASLTAYDYYVKYHPDDDPEIRDIANFPS